MAATAGHDGEMWEISYKKKGESEDPLQIFISYVNWKSKFATITGQI